MSVAKSTWARLLLVFPALVIIYFGYLHLSGSAGRGGVDLLGTGAAQENGSGGQNQQTAPVSAEMAAALRAQAAELERREAEIEQREGELVVLERDLLRLRRQVGEELAELEGLRAELESLEAERASERVRQIADTLKNVKAQIAAAQLVALYQQNRVTALYVISQLDARSSGKIFSRMTNAELAARILEDFNAWQVAEGN